MSGWRSVPFQPATKAGGFAPGADGPPLSWKAQREPVPVPPGGQTCVGESVMSGPAPKTSAWKGAVG